VSQRIREEFEKGRDYYQLHGLSIAPPRDPQAVPNFEYLQYHAERVFRETASPHSTYI
jgi:putative restriction endonuclease